MKLSTRLLFALLTLLPLASTMAATYAGHATRTEKQQRRVLAVVTTRATPPDASLTLNLFPNPARGLVTVQLTQKPGQVYKLRLSNIIGKEIRLVPLLPELTEAGQLVDLRDLPTGMYFSSLLVNDKAVSTKRLVLQN